MNEILKGKPLSSMLDSNLTSRGVEEVGSMNSCWNLLTVNINDDEAMLCYATRMIKNTTELIISVVFCL